MLTNASKNRLGSWKTQYRNQLFCTPYFPLRITLKSRNTCTLKSTTCNQVTKNWWIVNNIYRSGILPSRETGKCKYIYVYILMWDIYSFTTNHRINRYKPVKHIIPASRWRNTRSNINTHILWKVDIIISAIRTELLHLQF